MRLTNIKNGKYKVYDDGRLIGAAKIFFEPVPRVYPFVATAERGKGYEKGLEEHLKRYMKRKGYAKIQIILL